MGKIKSILQRIFFFDPKISFVSLPIFKLVVVIFVSVFMVSSFLIVFNSRLYFDFSFIGFNNFINYFRFPLGSLAVSIPVVMLLAANHRSVQTMQQILASESQSRFSNYYKHIEEFERYLVSHTISRNNNEHFGYMENVRLVHAKIFPESFAGDFKSSAALLEMVNDFCDKIIENFKFYYGGHPKDMSDSIYSLERLIRDVEGLVNVVPPEAHGSSSPYEINGVYIASEKAALKSYFFMARLRLENIYRILQFDIHAAVITKLPILCRIDVGSINPEDLIDGESHYPFRLLRDDR